MSEKKETKKSGEKSPLQRERERVERFFSLLPPFPEEFEKDDDASDKRRTRTILLFLFPFPSLCTPCARGRVFIYASSARLDSFSPLYPKREMHFFPNRARERAGEREREREREREKRLKE